MTALCIALVSALGLALGHSDQGTEDELEHSGYSTTEEETTNVETTSALALVSTEVLTADTNSTHTNESPGLQDFVLMVAVPLAALVILLSVVLLVVYLKSRRHKQEPPSQGSQSVFQTYEPIGENLKVPIFEEDTPSVMEIEMEELDRWMSSMNRNADYECLPTLKEEKEPNLSPRPSWKTAVDCIHLTAKESKHNCPLWSFILFLGSRVGQPRDALECSREDTKPRGEAGSKKWGSACSPG
uniref:transmembrane protein 154 isoform X2 n=1 Tax=Myodes glareolus TaxID=447135 RepID=UPI002021AA81|nr:transmembrane protein 154 isoform X2 [Myodes glareolus]